MFSLLSLPTELTRYIIFALDDPPDLLHVALTCKFFYELIIPTYHLHLSNISCSDSETPLEFWEKLHDSRHFGAMIRQLEICDDWVFEDLSYRRVFRGQRINEEFVSAWTGSSPRLPTTPASTSQGLIQSLSSMEGLTSVSIFKGNPYDEYDGLLYDMSKNFSQSLKVLHVDYGRITRPDGYVPRYNPSDCSFHHLTTCSLEFGFEGKVPEPFNLLLNGLASSCHTLVNFALVLTSCQEFLCLHWVKKAHWPSLKRLTLIRCIQLVGIDKTTPQEEIVDSFLSFFSRHSQLECLYLEGLGRDENQTISQFLAEHNDRLRDFLPSLRSLQCHFSIPPNILSHLVHVGDLHHIPHKFYPLAQCLRSCDLFDITLHTFEAIVEYIPQLERLAMSLTIPEDCAEEFKRSWDKFPTLLGRLENLTHLALYIEGIQLPEHIYYAEGLADYLPSLTYAHVWSSREDDEWLHVTVDPENPEARKFTSLKDSPDQSFRSEFWGDFFMGPTMDL